MMSIRLLEIILYTGWLLLKKPHICCAYSDTVNSSPNFHQRSLFTDYEVIIARSCQARHIVQVEVIQTRRWKNGHTLLNSL